MNDDRCGRPTKSGRACVYRCLPLRWRDPLGWTAPACKHHLTREEMQEFYRIEAQYEERRQEAERRSRDAVLAAADDVLDVFKPINRMCRAEESCGQMRVTWKVTTGLPDPHACWDHLTSEQRHALNSARAAVQATLDRLALEPECWSWPVPEPRTYATEEEADAALSEWQLLRGCAICGSRGRLVEDHDHSTGLSRGNLCHSCNIKEGWGADSLPFVKYRERHPAAILGVKVRYWSIFHGYAEPEPPVTNEDWRELQAASDRLTLPHPGDFTGTET